MNVSVAHDGVGLDAAIASPLTQAWAVTLGGPTETLMRGAHTASQAAVEAGAKGTLAPFEQASRSDGARRLYEGLAGILIDRPYAAVRAALHSIRPAGCHEPKGS